MSYAHYRSWSELIDFLSNVFFRRQTDFDEIPRLIHASKPCEINGEFLKLKNMPVGFSFRMREFIDCPAMKLLIVRHPGDGNSFCTGFEVML